MPTSTTPSPPWAGPWPGPTATPPSRPATCTSPTGPCPTGPGEPHRVFAFTLEMYPRSSSPGFYPPDEVIGRETSRNRAAVLYLLGLAACPYRATGQQARYCA